MIDFEPVKTAVHRSFLPAHRISLFLRIITTYFWHQKDHQMPANQFTPTVYSLTGKPGFSGTYQETLSDFGRFMRSEMETRLGTFVDQYMNFQEKQGETVSGDREVFLFEALMLGVFWNTYGGYAAGSGNSAISLMQQTASLRSHGGLKRKAADIIRGALAYRLLEKPSDRSRFLFPDPRGLARLIAWMKATGEFHREAARLETWKNFLEQMGDTSAFVTLSVFRGFARWFSHESLLVLGPFTEGVTRFVAVAANAYPLREDKISVLRSRTEYHLNMLGADIYNRAMKPGFDNCSERIVLLPACMKLNGGKKCQSAIRDGSEICTGCTAECNINVIRKLGKKHNFGVEIIRHSSALTAGNSFKRPGTAFVGVACAATVIAGGLELRKHEVPAQCVLLNHSGCRHWSNKPVATSLNISELMNRLGIETDQQPVQEVKCQKSEKTLAA